MLPCREGMMRAYTHHLLPVQDGVIHKDEFAFALFKAQNHSNIFVDKVKHIQFGLLALLSQTCM